LQNMAEKFANTIEKGSKNWYDLVGSESGRSDKRYWSGKNLEGMANKCGLGELYAIQYTQLCTEVHFDPDCVRQQFDDERGTVGFLKDAQEVQPIVLEACLQVTCIAELTNSRFGLGLNDSINKVKKQLSDAAGKVGIPPGDWFN